MQARISPLLPGDIRVAPDAPPNRTAPWP